MATTVTEKPVMDAPAAAGTATEGGRGSEQQGSRSKHTDTERSIARVNPMVRSVAELLGEFLIQYADQKSSPLQVFRVGALDLYPTMHRLNVILGMPGAGKTSFLLQTASQFAGEGYKAVYITYEMSVAALLVRLISQMTQIPSRDILDKKVNVEHLKALIAESIPVLTNIYIMEGQYEKDMRATIKSLKSARIAIFIDYLQRMPGSASLDPRMRVDFNLGVISRISRDFNAPTFVLSSMNRTAYEKGGLDGGKDSGLIEYDGDSIQELRLVHRKEGKWADVVSKDDRRTEKEKPISCIRLAVEKNRHGEEGSTVMSFRKETQTFFPLSNEEKEDATAHGGNGNGKRKYNTI